MVGDERRDASRACPEDLRLEVRGLLGTDAPGELDDPRWGELLAGDENENA